jgi:hypothetical protein
MHKCGCSGLQVHRAVVVASSEDGVRVKVPSALGPTESIALSNLTVPEGSWYQPSVGEQILIALENTYDAKVHYITTATSNNPPVGAVIDYTGTTAPNGWVLIAGQTLINAEAEYPRLWAVSPSAWKSGSDLVLPSNETPTLGLSKLLRVL